LQVIPYGEYLVKVYLENNKIAEQRFTVTTNSSEVTIKVGILSSITFRVTDSMNSPLINYPLTIRDPKGRKFNITTGRTGNITIYNAYPGTYIFQYNWANLKVVEVSFLVESKPQALVDIKLPLKTIKIRIEEEKNKPLPPRILLRVKYRTVVIANITTRGNEYSKDLTLERIPSEEVFTYEVIWQGNRLDSNTFVPKGLTEDLILITLSFYNLKIMVKDLDNMPLTNAFVKIEYPNGTIAKYKTSEEGKIRLSYLIEGDYSITIYWWGINVGKETIDPDKTSEVTIQVNVKTL